MANNFEGILFFHYIDEESPSAVEVLKECSWDINRYNAPHLLGEAAETSHELVELTADQAFGTVVQARLPVVWSEASKLMVVGNIGHTLVAGNDFIVARTSDFRQAGVLAGRMGYRPALGGEFLQLLRWLQRHGEKYSGWFFCYAGRNPGYAILAEYNGYRKPASLRFLFDTLLGNQVEEGYISANADTHCLFVH